MQLKCGSYEFDSNSVQIATRCEPLWTEGGQVYALKWLWDVEGYLSADGQAALTTSQRALEAALSRQRQGLILYRDDGSESATTLKNAGSITGVRITRGPEFTGTAGSEYATERKFSFSAEAEYPVSGAGGILLDYQETIRTWGGGPQYIHKAAVNGPPQKQLLYQQTPYMASQSGSARGYLSYPTPNAPLWAFALRAAPTFEQTNPKRRNIGKYEGFLTTWSYEFESATALVGSPNLWR